MDPIDEEWLLAMIKSVVTLDNGRRWLGQLGEVSRATGDPVNPLAVAILERCDWVVQSFQEDRIKDVEDHFLGEALFISGLRGRMVSVLQESIEQAFRDKKPITDCAIQLLKNLVASGKYPELVDILARAEEHNTNRVTKSDHRPPSQGASSHGPDTASAGSAGSRTATRTLSFQTALSLAMKASFYPDQLTKEERTAASILGFGPSNAASSAQ